MNRLEFIVVMVKLFLGGMQFITFTALSRTTSENMEGKEVAFRRSFFVAFVLFVSVMGSFIPYIYVKMKDPKGVSSITPKVMMRVCLSGFCDFLAQTFVIMSNANIPVSLLMILKGSRALFSAGLSLTMLKKKLHAYQWVSIAICLIGLSLASLGSYLSKTTSSSNLFMGVGLVLAAEAFRSVRIVYDEKMMKVYKYDPFMIIGLEGFVGTICSGCALITVNFLSGSDMGSVENFENTIYMINHSDILLVLLILLPIWVNSMYISGCLVTKIISAVYNAIVTVATVVVCWAYELLIYYLVDKKYGDPWTPYSFIQLAGFGLIVASTLMYDATWKLPRFFNYGSASTIEFTKPRESDESTVNESVVKQPM
jgi:drug/metabolite transporter (DMT)-like permease